MVYTQNFNEEFHLLGKINPASHSTEQNLAAYVDLSKYQKAVIVIHTGVIGGDLDVDIEQATTTAGASAKAVDSNGKDITVDGTTGDSKVYLIEVRTDELDVSNGFDCLNVEVTPAAAGIFGVQVFGAIPRYTPGSSNGGFDGVTVS